MALEGWKHAGAGEPVGHALTQIQQRVDDLLVRVSAVEARLYAAPIVVDETAYYPVADVSEGQTVRTMVASNAPTNWVIVDESMNGLPTTGYWAIDADGAVTPTAFGVGGVKKFATVEIIVRATNEFGAGDGKFDIRFT